MKTLEKINKVDNRKIIRQLAEDISHKNYEQVRQLALAIGKAIRRVGDGSDTPKDCVMLLGNLIKSEYEGIETLILPQNRGSIITRASFTDILLLAAKIGANIRYSFCEDKDKLTEYVIKICTTEFAELIDFEKYRR